MDRLWCVVLSHSLTLIPPHESFPIDQRSVSWFMCDTFGATKRLTYFPLTRTPLWCELLLKNVFINSYYYLHSRLSVQATGHQSHHAAYIHQILMTFQLSIQNCLLMFIFMFIWIFKKYMKQGEFSNLLKIVKIKPIPKISISKFPDDYRLTSNLSTFSKIFEKFINSNMWCFYDHSSMVFALHILPN